jgi:hypothetical protein
MSLRTNLWGIKAFIGISRSFYMSDSNEAE